MTTPDVATDPAYPRIADRASIRQGDTLYSATRFEDGGVSIATFTLRQGFDGTAFWHYTKPGGIHATQAVDHDGVLVPAPPEPGDEDDHLDLAVLVPVEVRIVIREQLWPRWHRRRDRHRPIIDMDAPPETP